MIIPEISETKTRKMSELKELIQDKLSKESFSGNGSLKALSQKGLELFNEQGIPTVKHEEWKYARIKNVFSDKMILNGTTSLNAENIKSYLLEGNLAKNVIVFINGVYNKSLSTITESENNLVVKSLSAAAEDEDAEFVKNNLGHSQRYHQDGINALNAAFAAGGAGEDMTAALDGVIKIALEQRQAARERKDFAASDAIRDGLASLGITIEDTAQGPRWSISRDGQ